MNPTHDWHVASHPSLRPERVRWRELAAVFADEHRQGEHVAVVGVNGSGKSTLLLELAKLRAQRRAADGRPSRVTVLATKPRDSTLEQLGWPRIRRWPPEYGQEHVVVWPSYGDPRTVVARQRGVFEPLLAQIFQEGGQSVVFDEVARFASPLPGGLGLRELVRQYWAEARSSHLSAFGGTQRPAHVPRAFWSESDWLAIFPLYDHDDLRRVTEIGGKSKELLGIVSDLDEHEFLFIRRRGSRFALMAVSELELG